MPAARNVRVVIVGAGFGGIGAAIELRRRGIRDVTILERGPGIGGTWYYNSYPGCACDVPSHLYSFSYAQRRDWSRICSPQEEILGYLRGVAADHGVAGQVVPDTDVQSCTFSEQTRRWSVAAADGRGWEADALIIATGQLNQPAVPQLQGAGEFAGRSFHSARWDHDYDLRGKRVAVVGTGASAVQLVPEVAQQAERLYVFQRTGNWFLPRRNRAYPSWWKAMVERVPGVQALRRRYVFHYTEVLTLAIRHPRSFGRLARLWSTAFMRMQLRDPEVRRTAWPDYTFGCKRILFSSHFLPALQRSNVELVTEPIARLEHDGIVTADGMRRGVDCIIYGTGFRTTEFMFPMELTGVGGRTLREAWAGGAHAHFGITVPGFPSLFIVYGPNTNTSGGSIIFYEEAQVGYIAQAIAHMRDRGVGLDVRPEVEAAFDRDVQSRFAGTAWMDCDSWYRTESGRIVTNWPGYMREYADRVRVFEPADFRLLEGGGTLGRDAAQEVAAEG